MAMIRIETEDLWVVGAFHGAWNFFQGPILGVAVSGTNSGALIFKSIPTQAYEWLNGGRFGIEGSGECNEPNVTCCVIWCNRSLD